MEMMSNIEELGIELAKVKKKYPEFTFVRSTRRMRDPEFYKLYIHGDWIGELWDSEEGHLWTNLVSEKERVNAPLLLKGKTLKHPSTQHDVLYVKDTDSTGGFKCCMRFSSVSRIYDVMESMILTYKGKDTNLSSCEYVEVAPPLATPKVSKSTERIETKKTESKPISPKVSIQENKPVNNSGVKKVKRRKVL